MYREEILKQEEITKSYILKVIFQNIKGISRKGKDNLNADCLYLWINIFTKEKISDKRQTSIKYKIVLEDYYIDNSDYQLDN